MKQLFALLCSLVILASGFAQTPAGTETVDTETRKEAPKTTTPKSTKAPVRIVIPPKDEKAAAKKTDATKKSDAAKKGEPEKKEEPKIKGITVARGERGFLGVEIVNGAFKITFYDAKKKPVEPDVARAVLRWDPKYKVGQERIVLNPDADGKSLSAPRTIRPPYNFKLFITLIKEPSEKEDPVGETHVIDFRA